MRNQQVLVIEDEPEFRANLVEILRSAGWQVTEASGGKAALDWLQSDRLDRVRPDIVLCDLMMPEVDGFAVLHQLRKCVETADIPFVFLTAKAKSDDLRQGMIQGADDYLLKPIRRSDLLATLKSQLQKSQRRQDCATQLTQSQQAVQAQLQMAQLREQESQLWINGITHDLRAPLTTIKVALELIEQAPEKRSQYLSIARQACAQSDALIEEMLTFYRDDLAEPERSIDPLTTNLSHLLLDLHQTFAARARLHDLILEWDSDPLPDPLLGSPLHLQRILTELLNNAFKYTLPSSKVQLQARTINGLDKGLEVAHVEFIIRNQAEISPQSLSKIFNKFYRITDDNSESGPHVTWQNQGSGLGLSIVKQLVAQLNGTLTVASQAGWTTFTLHLPLSGSMVENDRAIVPS